MPRLPHLRSTLVLALLVAGLGMAASPAPSRAADIHLWVNPVAGNDANSGATRAESLRTVAEAWRRIPANTPLVTTWRIDLVAGTYPDGNLPNYWESRHGTEGAQVIISAVDGPGTAVIHDDFNVFDTSWLTLDGLAVSLQGDPFHCEACNHLTIRNSTFDGRGAAQETIKVNQSQYVTLAGNSIGNAWDNAVDFVAVQHGSITGNLIYGADDWCIYVKGGSADIWLEGNEIRSCGTGGFTAGQGTGFQFMVAPWITYEAEDITFVGNWVHDTVGAGMGVNGGRNILLEGNTLERIGTRSHLLEITFGGRGCDGGPDPGCAANLAAGGWGNNIADNGENYVRIPNRNVVVRDNYFLNPPGTRSQWQHFFVPGPWSGPTQVGSNAPNPAYADDGLVITGNVIRNGDSSMPLGIGGEQGCADANPTCNATQLLRDNDINGAAPVQTRTPTATSPPGSTTATPTAAATGSLPAVTPTRTSSATPLPTVTTSPSRTPTASATVTPSRTATLTRTPMPTPTVTATRSSTTTRTPTVPASPSSTGTPWGGFLPGDRVVTTTSLSLRASPSIYGTLVTVMPTGTSATVLSTAVLAGGYHWLRIQTATATGYAAGEYLRRAAPTASPAIPGSVTPTPSRTATSQPTFSTTATRTVTPSPTVSTTATRSLTPTPSISRTATPLPTSDSAWPVGSSVIVTATALNLRLTPGLAGTVLAVIPSGTTGVVLEPPRAVDGYTWYRISTRFGTGWAVSAWLRLVALPTATVAVASIGEPVDPPVATVTPAGIGTPGHEVPPPGVSPLPVAQVSRPAGTDPALALLDGDVSTGWWGAAGSRFAAITLAPAEPPIVGLLYIAWSPDALNQEVRVEVTRDGLRWEPIAYAADPVGPGWRHVDLGGPVVAVRVILIPADAGVTPGGIAEMGIWPAGE